MLPDFFFFFFQVEPQPMNAIHHHKHVEEPISPPPPHCCSLFRFLFCAKQEINVLSFWVCGCVSPVHLGPHKTCAIVRMYPWFQTGSGWVLEFGCATSAILLFLTRTIKKKNTNKTKLRLELPKLLSCYVPPLTNRPARRLLMRAFLVSQTNLQ